MIQELSKIAELAGEALLRLQSEVLEHMKGGDQIHHKGLGDFATQADIEAERIILKELKRAFPEIPVVAEESNSLEKLPPTYLTVDPLDGTIIYSRGCREWGTTITLVENGRPQCGVIYLPATGVMVQAEKGKGCFVDGRKFMMRNADPENRFILGLDTFYNTQPFEITEFFLSLVQNQQLLVTRSLGSAIGNTVALLRGEIDVYYCARAKAWDVACCVLAVEEAGGGVHAILEDSFDWANLQKGQVFSSNKVLAERIGRIARAAFAKNES